MAIVTVLVAGLRRRSAWSTSGGPSAGRSGRPRPLAAKERKAGRITEAEPAPRAGRPAPDADGGAGAGQGLADLPRLARRRRTCRGSTSARSNRCASPGATSKGRRPPTAIWQYGIVPDPYNRRGVLHRPPHPGRPAARRPTRSRGCSNRVFELQAQIAGDRAARRPTPSDRPARAKPTRRPAIDPQPRGAEARDDVYQKLKAEADDAGREGRRPAEKAGEAEADALRRQAAALHSPPIPMEMTFNIYRTTKGQRRRAGLRRDRGRRTRAPAPTYRNIFPIREYYTNKQYLPAVAPGRLARRRSGSRSAASARRSTWAWPRATSTSWPSRATSAPTS